MKCCGATDKELVWDQGAESAEFNQSNCWGLATTPDAFSFCCVMMLLNKQLPLFALLLILLARGSAVYHARSLLTLPERCAAQSLLWCGVVFGVLWCGVLLSLYGEAAAGCSTALVRFQSTTACMRSATLTWTCTA